MISGVYILKNTVNKKTYIGSSIDIEKRILRQHFKRYNGNTKLSKAIKKYGSENFYYEVLINVNDLIFDKSSEEKKKILIEHEQYFLDTLIFAKEYIESGGNDKRFLKISYNICPTASNNLGKKLLYFNVKNSRKIIQYDRQGNYLEVWNSITKCSINLNIGFKTISKNARSESRGRIFSFRYYFDPNFPKKINFKKSKSIGAIRSEATKRKISLRLQGCTSKNKKPIILKNQNGIHIKRYESISNASKDLKISVGAICNVLQKRIKFTNKVLYFEYE